MDNERRRGESEVEAIKGACIGDKKQGNTTNGIINHEQELTRILSHFLRGAVDWLLMKREGGREMRPEDKVVTEGGT